MHHSKRGTSSGCAWGVVPTSRDDDSETAAAAGDGYAPPPPQPATATGAESDDDAESGRGFHPLHFSPARGLHSSTFQLNLSHVVTKSTLRIPQNCLRLRE